MRLQRDQYSLFPETEPISTLNATVGEQRKVKGIKKAVKSAEDAEPKWLDKAYGLFKKWLAAKEAGHSFMMEEAREQILKELPAPPSNRAFGGVAVRARRDGLIISTGLDKVSNAVAHRCFASRWKKTIACDDV